MKANKQLLLLLLLLTLQFFLNSPLSTFCLHCPPSAYASIFLSPYQGWAHVPGFRFPCSRFPGILGTRERGKANFLQESGNKECEKVGTLISRS